MPLLKKNIFLIFDERQFNIHNTILFVKVIVNWKDLEKKEVDKKTFQILNLGYHQNLILKIKVNFRTGKPGLEISTIHGNET